MDLARAQLVNKSWYCVFGRDALWVPHLSPSSASSLSRPAKVEFVRQKLLKECWERSEVKVEQVIPHSGSRGAALAQDKAWMVTYGTVISLWRDLESATPVIHEIEEASTNQGPHQDYSISGGAVSPDGTYILTTGCNGVIAKWKGFEKNQQATGTLIAGKGTPVNPHKDNSVFGITISNDGTWALSFGDQGILALWKDLNTESPEPITVAEVGKYETILACSISSDGNWALTVGHSGFIAIWKGIQSGNFVATVLQNNNLHGKNVILDCVIAPDNSYAITVGAKGKCLHWSGLTSKKPKGVIIGEKQLKGFGLKGVTLSPDGSWALLHDINENAIFLVNHLDTKRPQVKLLQSLKGPNFEALQKILIPSSSLAIVVGLSKTYFLRTNLKEETTPH